MKFAFESCVLICVLVAVGAQLQEDDVREGEIVHQMVADIPMTFRANRSRREYIVRCCGGNGCTPKSEQQRLRPINWGNNAGGGNNWGSGGGVNNWGNNAGGGNRWGGGGGGGGWGSSPLFITMTPPVFFTRTFTPTVFIPTTPPLFFPVTTIFIKTKKPKKKKTKPTKPASSSDAATTPAPDTTAGPEDTTAAAGDTTVDEATTEASNSSEETTTVLTAQQCTNHTCPAYTCKRDDGKAVPPIFINTGAHLAAPPVGGQFIIACGKLYFFSTFLKNETDAGAACCSMGLKLAAFNNVTERICLSEMVSSAPFFDGQPRLFWTSGSSFACNFTWCLNNNPNETIENTNGSFWMSGFPRGWAQTPDQDCVRLLVDRAMDKKLAINTDYCNQLNYYVCQGETSLIYNQALVYVWPTTTPPPTTMPTTTTTSTPCLTQKCPEAMCKREPGHFVNNGVHLAVPATNGQLKIACGRLYMFSSNLKSLPDAITTCCAMGMTLATFGEVNKQNCVNEMANFDGDFSNSRQFWTSGATSFCAHRWCTTNGLVANVNWMTGFPKPVPAPPGQDCLRIMLGKGVSVYNTDTCPNINNYVCEGDVTLLQNSWSVPNWPTTTLPPTTTTTPTPTPPCQVQCPTFQCEKNLNYFAYNNSVLALPESFGMLKEGCGKLYLFSRAQVSQTEAAVACCQIGMQLLSVETRQEHDCLHSLNQQPDLNFTTRGFWTSGSQRGCPLKVFKWCSTNEALNAATSVWAPGQPNNANGVQDCIQFTLNPGPASTFTVVNDESCFTPFNFICEGPTNLLAPVNLSMTTTPMPACNASCQTMNCEKDPSLYSPNGKTLLLPSQTGLVKEVCGKAIIFGNVTRTYQDAMTYCCQAGMQLLSIETYEEWTCLTDFNFADMKWIGRKNWVTATTQGCPRHFRWCPNDNNGYFPVNETMWRQGQPQDAGVQPCVQFVLNSGGQSVLNDEYCNTQAYYACEGPPYLLPWYTTTTQPPTVDPAKCVPKCPNHVCERNPLNFTVDGRFINESTTNGFFKEYCGKLLFFSYHQTTNYDAYVQCCNMGMRLLSVEDQNEHQCLVDLNNAETKYNSKVFWTSGSDTGCPFKFKWCGAGVWFSNATVNWLPGQPNNGYGVQDCVQLTLNTGTWVQSAYNDEPCTFSYPYICEGERLLYRESSLFLTTAAPTTTTTTSTTTRIPTTTRLFNCDPVCPPYTCERDPYMFNNDGRFLNTMKVNGDLREFCGKIYFFSPTQETYTEAASSCCDMGMTLVSVESSYEFNCITNQNQADMKYINKIFWTSGSDRGCPYNFRWCTAPTPSFFTSTSIEWQPGQPNNMNGVQDCVQLTLNSANATFNAYNDEPCLYANHYICEGDSMLLLKNAQATTETPSTTPTPSTSTTPPCNATCSQIGCDKDVKMFTADGKYLSDFVLNSNTVGILAEVCGKIYYFGNKPVSAAEANAICCSMGMNSVAVETLEENKCIAQAYGSLGLPTRNFWTSASQKGCNLYFRWCSSNTTFGPNSINWVQGQPNNLAGIQDCVQMSLTQGNAALGTFNDDPCAYSYYYLCEGDSSMLWKNSNQTTTTTTTTVPPCVANCPAASCDKDLRLFTPDGKYLTDFITNSNAAGILSESCGKVYYFGNRMVNSVEASAACCSMGMTSVAVETMSENQCLTSLYALIGLPQRFYWTSASQKGCNLYFKWCSSNVTFGPNSINWVQGQPNNLNGVQDCVQINLSPGNNTLAVFNDDPCLYTYYFMCEGETSLLSKYSNVSATTTTTAAPTTTPPCYATCPNTICDKDIKMFTSDGRYLSEYVVASNAAGVLIEICGKLYFFGNKMVSSSEASGLCCSMGMTSVAVETMEENKCLTNAYALAGLPSRFYWTSASQKGCNLYFKWCSSNVAFGPNSINWVQGQPNNLNGVQDCVQMTLTPGNATPAAFNDDPCAYAYYYLCEGETFMLQKYANTTNTPPTPSPSTSTTSTSTTTPPQNCSAKCPAVVCEKDPSLSTPDGKYIAVPSPIGTVKDACGRAYLFSNKQQTRSEAAITCCEAGMTLVAIETAAEHECLTQLNNADMKFTNKIHWTSGHDQGCPFNFRWCPSNATFSNTSINWLTGQPNNLNGIQDCVQLMLTTGFWTASAFNDESCGYANYFICEADRSMLQTNAPLIAATSSSTTSTTTTTIPPTVFTTCLPSCPSYTCSKNPSYFTPDGQFLVAPSSLGILRDTCDKLYFFGSSQLSYSNAAAACCDLGMVLVSVETSAEHSCLTDLNNVDMKWSGRNMWTSGSHQNCPYNFKWCTGNGFFYNNTINWQTGQPNNNFNAQGCVQMTINTGTWSASTYDDQPCGFINYYICEGSRMLLQINNINMTTTTTSTTPTPSTTCQPKCPVFQCDRDPSLFTSDGLFLNNPTSLGIIRETCGKLYFFSSAQVSQVAAATICCDLGMSLVSLETSAEHQCLTDLNNVDMRWVNRNLWTSGNDEGCPFNFRWCGGSGYFYNNSLNWQAGQPNNALNSQNCVQMTLNTGGWWVSTYDDTACNSLNFFACEGDRMLLLSNRPNSTTLTPTTTTTTIAPTTCQPKCPSYPCEKDPSLFTPDGKYWNVPSEFGWLKETCGKVYFFSKMQDSFTNAAASCCDLGMTLLSVETQQEHQCLTDLNNADMKMASRYHWTSGNDVGCPFNFRWCTSNSFATNTSLNWAPGQPNNGFGLHDCIQLMLTTGLWSASMYDDQPCNFYNYFICEGDRMLLYSNNPATTLSTSPTSTTTTTTTTTTPAPTCQPKCPSFLCERDPSYFTPDGKFLNLPGGLGIVRETCGKLYLFSSLQLNFVDSAATCCAAGMSLLSVETPSEHDCIANLNSVDMRYSNRLIWTSGYDMGCPFNFRWCTSSGFFGNNSINWQAGQPNNGRGLQDCVQLTMNTGTSSLSNYNDEYCSFTSFFACEGDRLLLQSNNPSSLTASTPTTTTTSTTTSPTTTCTPKCPTYSCERDPSFFTPDGKTLSVPPAYGFVRESCGRLYFIGTTQETYADALSYCCDYGMTLLSVENTLEHQCLSDLNNADMKYTNRIFWTSGYDQGCPFNFRWCSSSGFFGNNSINWFSGQPNNARNNQDCVQLTLNTGLSTTSAYNDEACTFASFYICEGDRSLLTNAGTITTTLATTTTTTTTTTTKPCTNPVCPGYTCERDPSLFTADGRYLNVPISTGYLKEICGKLYMFGAKQETYQNALSACCDVAMELVSIESTYEHTCITDTNNNELRFNNRMQWTSGTDQGCQGKYQWCTGFRQGFTNTSINWAFGQPDNQFGIERCIQFTLNTGLWTSSTFSDVSCTNNLFYVCEGDPILLQKNAPTTTIPTTTTTTTPTTTTPCQNPICSNPVCTPDSNYVNPDGSLKPIPSSVGYVKFACGRRYFISTITKTKSDSALICCVLGMKLLSIETNAELTCLSDLNKADAQLKTSQMYWTSGTDENCPFKYTWCGTNVRFGDTAWYQGQPDKYVAPENCVAAALNVDTATQRGYSGLNDLSCNYNNYFICE